MKKRFMVALAVLAALSSGFGTLSCSRGYSGPAESLTVGSVLLEPSALLFVAEAQDFFSQNGLDVSIQYYETGLSAVNAMLDARVDVAVPATEFVLAGKAFNDVNVKTIASIDKVDYAVIVGRKDRGIASPSDLAGKKVGVARGTILEFRLGRFLELHGMKTTDVEIVNLALGKSADAIAAGDIDALIAVPPYTEASKVKLGDNGVVWPAQGGQFSYQLLMGRTEWIGQNPKAIHRFLLALNQAEEYTDRRQREAKAIVQQKLNVSDDDVARIWSQNQFTLSLDQALVVAMEDQARWMIDNGLTTEKVVPDFLEYIYFDGLKAVKPEAVNIIR